MRFEDNMKFKEETVMKMESDFKKAEADFIYKMGIARSKMERYEEWELSNIDMILVAGEYYSMVNQLALLRERAKEELGIETGGVK